MSKRIMLSHDPFVQQLVKALGLPEYTIRLELRAAVDEIVTVRCEYHPTDENAAGFDAAPLLARYKLVEMGEAEPLSVKANAKPVVPQPQPYRRGSKGDLITAALVGLGPSAVLLVVWLVGVLMSE